MPLYGLIGYPLGHSFSKRYFTEKFERENIADSRYELFQLPDIQDFLKILADNPDVRGLNVTIPHKETVIPFLDELDDDCREIGAVNCIRVKDGKTKGYNTDVHGFEISLLEKLKKMPEMPQKALVLGTGGAAKAVTHTLRKLGISYQMVSRSPQSEREVNYADLIDIGLENIHLIVNTTPLGMAPKVDACPDIPFYLLDERHLVYDLVYNPLETLLLQRASERGAMVENGLAMLHGQAEKAWEIWGKERL